MSDFSKASTIGMALFSILWVDATSLAEDQKPEIDFRVYVPITENGKQSSEATIKNQLLQEKLIKMGRNRSQGCTRCHGRSGMQALAISTKWKGTVAEFVAKQLTAFRDGTRSHEVMSSVSKSLSDQDIALIATWYQSVSK